MKIVKNKWVSVILLTIILLLFLRIDFRFKYDVECCSDDYDYYLHASTIVFDFDLDYSNQDVRDFSYFKNDKTTPIGFIGSGILSSPFLFLGSQISNFLGEETQKELLNFQFLFYSLSSVIYFFFSYILIYKTMTLLGVKLKKSHILLFFAGSGLPYYAFERFSMTHVYEAFTISLLIYYLVKYYFNFEKKENIYAAFIPAILLISFLTRMSNFYIFLIPTIVYKLLIKEKYKIQNKLFHNKFFQISTVLCLFLYNRLVNILYGEFIINPQRIYGDTRKASDYIGSNQEIINSVIDLISTGVTVLFSWEFGIFWVSPILFIGVLACIYKLKDLKSIESIFILFCFGQNFFIIFLWQTAASSYGYRYLFSLVPLSFFIIFMVFQQNEIVNKYLYSFSIFSILSILFFETTELTQLSVEDQLNSFGTLIRYVEPEYVKGVVLSFLQLNSYLIIFTTSFVGAISFKFLISLFGIDKLILFLTKAGLPVDNQDFQTYLLNLKIIGIEKFIFILLLFSYISYYIIYKIEDKNIK